MTLARREFLSRTTAVLVAGAVASCDRDEVAEPPEKETRKEDTGGEWAEVRAQFALSDDYIHMSAMLLASHPKAVRDAIEKHRRGLDANPVLYLKRNDDRLTDAARAAAGHYLGIEASGIALTDSTTMGVGLVYNGLRLTPDQEILSTEEDYYVTHESVRLASLRTGAKVRKIALSDRIEAVSEGEIVDRIIGAVTPATRVVAVTWVHSSTGLKLPLRSIADALQEINDERDDNARAMLCVDGVHGFGVEDVELSDLGCDFLMAGCHKWLFGPRGTGIVAGTESAWRSLVPTIPSFIDDSVFSAWLTGSEEVGPTTAGAMTPGGFKPFEHRWAMTPAFEFHQGIGKQRVAARTHELATLLKQGLGEMDHVHVVTPLSEELSAGIVCFEVEGMPPDAVVSSLQEQGIIASVAPYSTQYVRLTPSILNLPEEIEAAVSAVHGLSG